MGQACRLHSKPPGCIFGTGQKYSEVDTWKGYGQQGEILLGWDEVKTMKKIF